MVQRWFSNLANNPNIGDGWNLGFRFAYNTNGPFGHEFQYTYNRPSTNLSDERMKLHQFGYNFLYYFGSRESTVHPFATVGVHFADLVLPESAGAPNSTEVKPGFNYGVGLKVRLSTMFGFRADAREYEIGQPEWGGFVSNSRGLLHHTEASAGIGVYF